MPAVAIAALAIAAGCAHDARQAAARCDAESGWLAGRTGQPRDERCAANDYVAAHRLGSDLLDLETRRAALVAQREAAGDVDANAIARQIRRIDVDIEAIRGIAVTRHWSWGGPLPANEPANPPEPPPDPSKKESR